jgi:hypothetical protein
MKSSYRWNPSWKLIGGVWLAALVLGCSVEARYTDEAEGIVKSQSEVIADFEHGTGVVRTIDKELGVVCYVFHGVNKGGIECLHYPELAKGRTPEE